MVRYLVIGGGIAGMVFDLSVVLYLILLGTTCVEELLQAGEEDITLLTAAASVKVEY